MDADGDEVMNEEDEGRSSGALERCSVAIIPPDTQALAQDERSKGEALKIAENISLGSSQGSGLAANDSVQSNTSRASVPDKLEALGDEVEPRNIAPPVHTSNNGVKEVGAGDDSWKNILTGDQGMSDTQVFFSPADSAKLGTVKGNAVSLPMEAISRSRDKWKSAIFAQVWNNRIRDEVLIPYLSSSWGRWQPKLSSLSQGIILAEFKEESQVAEVLCASPWFCNGVHVGIQRWCPRFKPGSSQLRFAPVWIRLHGLPIEYWDRACLFTIASAMGKPIKIDEVTLNGSRRSFARLCVELDLEAPLVEGIWIEDGLGSFWQSVSFEHIPGVKAKCFSCGATDHRSAHCRASRFAGRRWHTTDEPPKENTAKPNGQFSNCLGTGEWSIQGKKGAANRRLSGGSIFEGLTISDMSKPPGFENGLDHMEDRLEEGDSSSKSTKQTEQAAEVTCKRSGMPGKIGPLDQEGGPNNRSISSHMEEKRKRELKDKGVAEEKGRDHIRRDSRSTSPNDMDNKREEDLIMERFREKMSAHSERWWNLRTNTSKRHGTPPIHGGFEFEAVESEEGEIVQRSRRSISRD